MNTYLYLGFLVVLFVKSSGNEVRISLGVEKLDFVDPNVLAYEAPAPFWGPVEISFLNGACFNYGLDRNEYTVCPFQNVTQRRNGALRSTLLGVWNNWIFDAGDLERNNFKKLEFTNGVKCPKGVPKSVVLEFECNDISQDKPLLSVFGVLSVEDSNSCSYSIKLGIPLPCQLLLGREDIRVDSGGVASSAAIELTTDHSTAKVQQKSEITVNSKVENDSKGEIIAKSTSSDVGEQVGTSTSSSISSTSTSTVVSSVHSSNCVDNSKEIEELKLEILSLSEKIGVLLDNQRVVFPSLGLDEESEHWDIEYEENKENL